MTTLVFDNTVLSHFARAGQLDTLQVLVRDFRCVMPAEVWAELIAGVQQHPVLARAIAVAWVDVVELIDIEEIVAFARYKAEFGGGPNRNNGEAAVLAWASVNEDAMAVVDERAATRAAQRDGISAHGTLWLIANGVRDGNLTREAAEQMVDDLAATDMRLPVEGGGFFAYAYEEGLLP